MADNVLRFNIEIGGKATDVIATVVSGFDGLVQSAEKARTSISGFTATILKFNQISQAVQSFSQGLTDLYNPGIKLNSALADLSAITGETGEGLHRIEGYARSTAKAFGLDAASAVESYKLILSQLGPSISKTPDALKAMGDHIATLSKTMGGDATAAAEVLTTAMNQFGVSTEDPMQAAAEMSKMMNVMAAAAKEGSAELPQIKAALEQSGMAAKSAGVSFEEANAAIQVLDKAGRKGSEGGVALRNVMATLAQGRFLPKDVQVELQAAGVDLSKLTDKTQPLSARLRTLGGVMNDSALITKLFGKENSNAALALIGGVDAMEGYTTAISGTNTATEQAGVVMDSFAEKQKRMQATIDDAKISIFNATGDFGIYVQTVANSLVPIAQIMPLLSGVSLMFGWIKTKAILAYTHIGIYNGYLSIGKVANLGFVKNVIQASVALVRFATVGVWNAIKGVGALILSLITGGSTSVMFSTMASGAFGTFATIASTACKAVGVAIYSIPIIGWIALAITGLTLLFIWLYNKFDGVRALINGIGAALVAIFSGDWFNIGNAFDKAYDDTLADAKKRNEEAEKEDPANKIVEEQKKAEEELKKSQGSLNLGIPSATNNVVSGGGISTGSGDAKIKNVTIKIDKIVEKFVIQTTNIKEDMGRVKDMVAAALVDATNDLNSI